MKIVITGYKLQNIQKMRAIDSGIGWRTNSTRPMFTATHC